MRHSDLWIYDITIRLQRYELCERLGLTRLRVLRGTRLRLKERALVPLLLWQTYRLRGTVRSGIHRLQVEGCGAKGGRNCDSDGDLRLCDEFVKRDSTFLGGPFTRFYDYARVYCFTITTKPLRFRQNHDFRLFFLLCAYAKKGLCA